MCDEVIGSSSTSSPSANSYCGDDAIGYTEVCEADGYRYIISSGSPDHEAEYDQIKPNPNTRCKYIFNFPFYDNNSKHSFDSVDR